jgi:hypothetical protein
VLTGPLLPAPREPDGVENRTINDMIICGRPGRPGTAWCLSEKVLQTRRVQQPGQNPFFYSPGVTEPDATGPRPAAVGPLPRAGQVVRRVLLRRNIVIDAETAQLVAAAVQAALQGGAPARPPRQVRRAPAADCEPLF